jgi:3-phenylpropionate/trans-cinnamate dioxygenase ferredoxin reductase component
VNSVVVVGGGLAGAHTCEQLRAHGFHGRVALIGAESRPTYDRPPLSKEVLTHDAELPELSIDWDSLDIDRRLGVTATTLRRDGRRWTVGSTEGEISGDSVVIATGARARSAGLAGDVRVLRTWEDAVELRSRLKSGSRVVIIGAGWIGAEVASSAVDLGCTVTVVEAEQAPLLRVVGASIGESVRAWYADAGVRLIVGERFSDLGDRQVTLTSGEVLNADVVVVGIGVVPNTEWLSGAGIARDASGGVLVDEHLQSSLADVYAVGDCASYRSMRYGVSLRPEHWTNAQLAGAAVAARLAGIAEEYDPVPYFWSKQFGRMVQYCGHHSDDAELVVRGDPTSTRWSAGWVERGRLTAVLTVNKPGECVVARGLLETMPVVDPALLADPDVPLMQTQRRI